MKFFHGVINCRLARCVSLACPTASFCVATSTSNNLYTYAAGTWSSARQLVGADGNPANLTALSCLSSSFCMATGDLDAYTYNGGSWSQGTLVQSSNTFTSLSCASPDFCMATDNAGNVYTYASR
jgi:hypothetical protein